MREKVFRKPSVKDILKNQGIASPERITKKFLRDLMSNGAIEYYYEDYAGAVPLIESLSSNPQKIILFSESFRVQGEDSNYGIKSLESMVKIDSKKVLRELASNQACPPRLTKAFMEAHQITPSMLIETAFKYENVNLPPFGFYWTSFDGHVNAVTFLSAAAGAEMEMMKKAGDFEGEVIDKVPYGNNLRVKVSSRTEAGEYYKFSLYRLPMYREGDMSKFSEWVRLNHNSSDPDASYRGGEHNKRVYPTTVWSATAIFAFYEAMTFVKEHPTWDQFKTNPFPIQRGGMMQDIDNLRLRSLIIHRSERNEITVDSLNKGEINRFIGAKTILRGYNSCWRHWGKEDTSYLYAPCS